MMFSSLLTLSSSANTNSGSTTSDTLEVLNALQIQNSEGKILLTSKEDVERKLDSILTQVRQNQIKSIDLTSASLGRFYELVHTWSGNGVCSLAALPNGRLASSSADTTIKLWDLASGSCFSTLQRHTGSVDALVALPNGQLASGSRDTTIKLWDLTSNSCLSTLHGHADWVLALAVLPDGRLASISADTTIKLWDLTSHSCLSTLQGHASYVTALAVLPNGQLASGSADTTIKLWNLTSHSSFSTLKGHTDWVLTLAVLPNGQLASGSADTTIKFWDLAKHTCLSTLQEHTSSVLALSVLPSGLLVSGSADTTIKFWNLTSHSSRSTLQGHTSYVLALAAFPNGLLASGSHDRTIKLWKPKTLSARQLQSILIALKDNTSVAGLDLSHNPDIKDDIIDPLIKIFKNPGIFSFFDSKPNSSLKIIDLRETGVSKKGIRKLEKATQHQRLPIEVLSDCPVEWMIVYFLIIFCRANLNSPFADSGLDLCKHGELGPFLGIPCGFFARPRKNLPSSKRTAYSPN